MPLRAYSVVILLLGIMMVPQALGQAAKALGLHAAVYEDRTDDALALLAKGADPQGRNRYGISPLDLACTNGNAKLVAALLKAGADPKATGTGGTNPLMTAARTGVPGPVELLLEVGADASTRDQKGQTALMWAAVEGHAEAAKLLLAAGSDPAAELGTGFTAWFFAARQGHQAVIDVLLADGADVNAAMENDGGGGRVPRNGTSALILALENGHFELAARLLKAGADGNDMRSGFAPLHVLSWVRKPRRGDGIDGAPPPRVSGSMTSLEFASALLEHGAKVDARLGRAAGGGRLGRHGATAFLLASRTADIAFMKLLLEHGAEVTTPNHQGRTPLLAAAGIGLGPEADEAATEDEAVLAVKFLLDLGADIDVVDHNGETVMHAAAYKQSPKLVALFAERGADIKTWNRKSKHGRTPLLIAQGFRPGNFKPSEETVAALSKVMLEAGVEPPAAPPRPGTGKREQYKD